MAVVYKHTRMDNGLPFYIGIGKTIRRVKSKKYRNNYWHKIVSKHGYNIEILHTDISWEQACELEKLYIKQYGRSDLGLGPLVNMTDGGEGISNMSIESRKKISNSRIGKKLSDETKSKIGESSRKRHITQETREKISKIHKNKVVSDSSKKKMSKAKKGKYLNESNPQFGKKHSIESKRKISELKQGEKNFSSKLTNNDVNWIRDNYISKHPEFGCRALGRKFKIDSGSISKIINHKTWKHI